MKDISVASGAGDACALYSKSQRGVRLSSASHARVYVRGRLSCKATRARLRCRCPERGRAAAASSIAPGCLSASAASRTAACARSLDTTAYPTGGQIHRMKMLAGQTPLASTTLALLPLATCSLAKKAIPPRHSYLGFSPAEAFFA